MTTTNKEQKWNLDRLYTSFESDLLKQDFATVETGIQEALAFTTTAFADTSDATNKIKRYIELTEALTSKFELIYSFGSLVYSVNTEDTDALKLIEKMESLFPDFTLIEVYFRKWLKNVDNLPTLLKEDTTLSNYKYILLSEQEKSTYLLTDSEEKLLAEMKNTGSNAWSKLQDTMVSSLKVPFDGTEVPLTVIRNKAYDDSQEVRKAAYEAELKAYTQIDKVSAACLNAIKGEVISEAKNRGYDSPLTMTLSESRMDHETLNAMMTAILEYLPVFQKYLQKKTTMLGHSSKNGNQPALPFYDLFGSVGSVSMTYTYEEAQAFIVENFTTFSEKLGNFAKHAFEASWIDAFPRNGKVAGAFCANLHGIGESRIMSNFSGSFSDVSTLAHELGHGYHGDCLKSVSFKNSNYPMPLAETASIFCETIITHAALKTATPEEALIILENDIMGATQVIVDIYSRYLFETELFEKRKLSSLSVDELKDAMVRAQKAAYGEGLDPEFLHPYMWTCKPHYYSAGANFYNFPYAFGLLFAKGLYAKYVELGDAFLPKYDALLESTGCNSIHEVLALVDVDSHSPDFFRNSLKLIQSDIEKFLAY